MNAAGTQWMSWAHGLEELWNIDTQSDLPVSDVLSSSKGNQNDLPPQNEVLQTVTSSFEWMNPKNQFSGNGGKEIVEVL